MIKPTFDPETNTFLPAYGFQNDELYKKIQPRDAPEILISFKATKEINSKITASGGITYKDEISELKSLDIYGAIVGKAIYENTLNLEEIIKTAE